MQGSKELKMLRYTTSAEISLPCFKTDEYEQDDIVVEKYCSLQDEQHAPGYISAVVSVAML